MSFAGQPFWEIKALDQLSQSEWDALCDGCGKCCLHKLEDEDTGEVFYTDVSCRYLNESCRCTVYETRAQLVEGCIVLKPEQVAQFHWLPQSCAYRLVAEGQPLPEWHPLVSGCSESVHIAGISIRGKGVNEAEIQPDDLENHIIQWVE